MATQLTSHDSLESQHTYYDICPWSHDGRFILYSSAPVDGSWTPFGHDTLACRDGRVSVIDTGTGGSREVAGDAVYMKHGGAFCLWHPARHKVYYRRSETVFAGLDLATGEQTDLPAAIRQMSPDGGSFATVTRCARPGGQGAAVGVMAEDGSDVRDLVDRERLYELTPNRDAFRPEDMTLGNTKWRPDGRHLLIAMWVYPRPHARRSLYIASRDGTEVRWLTHFAHHHSWTADGRHILFNDRVPVGPDGTTEPRMHLIDFDGTGRRVVFDQPVGSHPLMHPDRDRILDADTRGIYVVRLDRGRIERLAEFAVPFDHTHHGTHPHPVWNHDGSQILYNSAETGHSELYLIPAATAEAER
ncbi:MAG: TolB family protein [Planctomycetota bacterium]